MFHYIKKQNNVPLTYREINLLSNSTLQNFHKELELEKPQDKQHKPKVQTQNINTTSEKNNVDSRPSLFQKIQEIEKSNAGNSEVKNIKINDKEW